MGSGLSDGVGPFRWGWGKLFRLASSGEETDNLGRNLRPERRFRSPFSGDLP